MFLYSQEEQSGTLSEPILFLLYNTWEPNKLQENAYFLYEK